MLWLNRKLVVYALLFFMASYLIYDNVIKPKEELKTVKRVNKELEENISVSSINRPIELDHAVIRSEANRTITLIEEMQSEEENITNNDVNYSDILNGMFLFKPERED